MKKTFKRVVVAAALCGILGLEAQSAVTPTIVARSQSRDKVRQVVGTVGHIDLYDMESWYGMGSIMVEYTQTFKPNQLTRCLFGDDVTTGTQCLPAGTVTPIITPITGCGPCSSVSNACSNNACSTSCGSGCIQIQGSQVANRSSTAWLADYFYLPTDFNGHISFKPKVQNVNIDLGLYIGFDEWWCGGYLWLYGPITWTKWNLNFCETITNAGTNSSPQGYFAPSCLSNNLLLHSFEQYASGGTITNCSDGVVFEPLKFARIGNCNKSKWGFADLRMELGWNFLNDEDYHLGVNVQAAAPTGTKRHAEWVFSPVVGNGKHWELGGGFRGHYTFWRGCDEDKSFSFYVDANITHIFKAREQRTFDLINNGPNSRYMLAELLTRGITNGLAGNPTATVGGAPTTPAAQFAGVYAPVANLTTFDIKTKVNVQADIVAWFNFEACGFSWDLGYNFWGRGCEKFECPTDCTSACNINNLCNTQQIWALKGDARTYGFVSAVGGGGLTANTPVALSATENNATIHSGTNAHATPSTSDPFYNNNAGVDNSMFAVAGTAGAARLQITPFLPDAASNQVKTSVDPIPLSCTSINFCQGTRGISHKLFTHFSYTWDRECWVPYVGIGGFAEWGKHEKHDSGSSGCNVSASNTSNCASSAGSGCVDCALSQWGVWLKGGVSFN